MSVTSIISSIIVSSFENPLVHKGKGPNTWSGDTVGWSVGLTFTGDIVSDQTNQSEKLPGDRYGYRWFIRAMSLMTTIRRGNINRKTKI